MPLNVVFGSTRDSISWASFWRLQTFKLAITPEGLSLLPLLVRAETTGFYWSVSGATASKCSAKLVQFLLPFHKQEKVSVCQRASLETGSERKKQEVNSAAGGPSPWVRFGMISVGTWCRCYFMGMVHLLPHWLGSVSCEQALSHRHLVGLNSLLYPSRSKIWRGCCYLQSFLLLLCWKYKVKSPRDIHV